MDPVVFFWLLALTALPRVQSGTNTEWGTVMDMVGCTGMPADGTKDQTAELQLCINQCLRNTTCSGMMFPAGRYLLQRGPLVFNNDLRPAGASPMTIRGQGRSTVFVWASTANLIEFSGKPGPTEAAWSRLTLDGMAVESMVSAAPDNLSCAINFTAGVTQSLLSNIIIAPGNPNVSPGGGIDLGPLTDTVTLDNCVMYIGGTGVRIGRGSEVRIKGGRISGVASVAALTGVGVHVTGNNGGVHVIGTDVIGHRIGVLLDDSSGAGSNREIFLSQATLDSNYQVGCPHAQAHRANDHSRASWSRPGWRAAVVRGGVEACVPTECGCCHKLTPLTRVLLPVGLGCAG